jgi:tRNA G18 (ribose-2'-O)-methylase SpoU
VTGSSFTLVGDGIENPHNALAMTSIAAALGAACLFLDRKGVETACKAVCSDNRPLHLVTLPELADTYRPIVACETLPDAVSLFGCSLVPGARPAVVVGNERLGLTQTVQATAHQRVRIPMAARGINSLNVAAAAAVTLYCLSRNVGPMRLRRGPTAHRPDLLLFAPHHHAEAGCALRSAAAFGWGRVLFEDRCKVWFSADREAKVIGRAAARRSKNSILVLPVEPERRYTYDETVVICATPRSGSVPLQRATLACGARQLIVIPDEYGAAMHAEQWRRLAGTMRFAHLGLSDGAVTLPYRATASIAMAEVARQVGRTPDGIRRRPPLGRYFDRSLDVIDTVEAGEEVALADLLAF